MTKRWLFQEATGRHTALGNAEDAIPQQDRQAIADVIPHGWRLYKYDETQWTLSRLLSYSVAHRVVALVDSIVDVTVLKSGNEKRKPSGWSSVQNALFTCGPEDSKPLLSGINDVLRYAGGSCCVVSSGVGDIDDGAKRDSVSDAATVRDAFMSMEMAALVPTISSLTLKDVRGLCATVMDQAFPVQPSFDGNLLMCNAPGIMASHLAMRAMKTCALAACTCGYDVHKMDEWWGDRASESGMDILTLNGLSTFGSPFSGSALHEIMTIVCVVVASSLYPTISVSDVSSGDSLPMCAASLLYGMQNANTSKAANAYAQYLCRDDASSAQVFAFMGILAMLQDKLNEGTSTSNVIPSQDIVSALLESAPIDAFREMGSCSSVLYTALGNTHMRRGVSQGRVAALVKILSRDILSLVFGDPLLADEYVKFGDAKDKSDLNRTLLAPESIWAGQDSLEHILESC